MAQNIPQNAHLIGILGANRKADIKKINNVLYSNKIVSFIDTSNGEIVLRVHFKNLVNAIKIAVKCIEENNLEVYLLNQRYWEFNVPEFWERRNNNKIL